jgi:hypothetical protein
MKHLILISRTAQMDQEEPILKLAGWMGVPTKKVTIGNDGVHMPQLLQELEGLEYSLAVSVETLTFLRNSTPPDLLQNFLKNQCAELLVFSAGRSGPSDDPLSWLTDGAVRRLADPGQAHVFDLPTAGRKFSKVFAGLNFSTKRAIPVPRFVPGNKPGPGIQEILVTGGQPVFLHIEREGSALFLLALEKMPDIDERLSQDTGLEESYDKIIPLLIFLRWCFGASCWHGPESTARLIIDDPLLDRSYGFLDYGELSRSMDALGYGTSIAFIPWNYWRTRNQASQIFDHAANLSICVHGCDHINREFDETDPGTLQWRAGTGLRRMERHQQRTGLPFEPVMVFPQGRFSSPALLALRTSGYLAAVNTTCFPTNAGADSLTVADFLRPAVTRFHGFPLFQRRYPRRLIDCAFDLFLGRPVLLVQHHEDFRNGYRQWEEFVSGVHQLAPELAWTTLSSQLTESCMMRVESEHSMNVQFFTRQFAFKNKHATRILFSKHEPDTSAISAVLVNGLNAPFSSKNEFLMTEYQANPGEHVYIEVLDKARPPVAAAYRRTMTYSVGVSVRRALSELRDNTLARHPRLLAAATGLARKMKATGTADPENA